jgi:hypothetical protein
MGILAKEICRGKLLDNRNLVENGNHSKVSGWFLVINLGLVKFKIQSLDKQSLFYKIIVGGWTLRAMELTN